MYIRSSYASWCVVIQAGTICHHSKKHPQACRWTGLWDQKYSTGQALPCYAINLLALTHGLPRKWRKTNVFAKTTIILSYPFVYCFKPICYGMIVAILNYHSSIITIMAKDDNMLCINYTIKTGTVREQVRNLLKRLLFSSRQAFLLSKTACKAAWDPGVPIMETRVRERCRPGSVWGLYGDAWMFIRHVGGAFMPCFGIFFADGCFFGCKRKVWKSLSASIRSFSHLRRSSPNRSRWGCLRCFSRSIHWIVDGYKCTTHSGRIILFAGLFFTPVR